DGTFERRHGHAWQPSVQWTSVGEQLGVHRARCTSACAAYLSCPWTVRCKSLCPVVGRTHDLAPHIRRSGGVPRSTWSDSLDGRADLLFPSARGAAVRPSDVPIDTVVHLRLGAVA